MEDKISKYILGFIMVLLFFSAISEFATNDVSSKEYNPYVPIPVVVTRPLNTSFTISTIRPASVNYTIRIAYNVTALLTSTGSATLQYYNGTTWISLQSVSNNINLGVVLSGYNDYGLSATNIPANAPVKIVTAATNATVSYTSGTESF